MKLLLSHGYFLAEDEVEKKVMRPYPPLGLLYVSAFLKQKNIDHQLFDSTFSSYKEWIDNFNRTKPRIIALYANFLTRKKVIKIIKQIRETQTQAKTKIIIGGPDVKYNTDDYLNRGVDFCVIGEGEETLHELYVAVVEKGDFNQIKGIVYKEESGLIKQNTPRDHLSDLDDLPIPNRSAIDMNQYLKTWKDRHGYSSVSVNTQRGCPYTCKWCSHAVFGDTYRRRSVKNVIEEIKSITKNYSPDRIWFVDDVFTHSEKWIIEFEEIVKAENVSIEYECITRADRLNKNILQALKITGCKMLWIGAESGSQQVLDFMDRRVKAENVREMIQLANEIGIETGTFIMLGYPGEKQKDIKESIKHLKRANPGQFTINLAYPIHGTKLFEEVKDKILNPQPWFDIPDKDLDFERTYSKRYYDFAIRWVYNDVNASKNMDCPVDYLKFKIRSLAARLGMMIHKNLK